MTGRATLRGRIPLKMRWVLALCLFMTGASAAMAQLPTATILGVVKDATGAVVPGAGLTTRNTETGQTRTAVSSGDGAYRFSALPVGNYEVRAEQSGFQTALRTGVTLAVSQEAVVNFTLEVGAITQTVAVSAEASLVNTTSGSLGGLVEEAKIADLPLNGRNYIDLSLLQTGVMEFKPLGRTSVMTGVWFSSNGAPLHSNNFLLDGASMVNMIGAASASIGGSTLGVEGIREYRVITNSFSAEYGMTMGSQMVIVSKGGTNSFHGSAFEYLRNSALDARNFFDYKTAATPRRLPPFTRNNFGGSFGGPIRKDKTFFFATYEGLRERLGVTTGPSVMGPGCHGAAGAVITLAACPQLGTTPSVTIAPQTAPLLALFPLPNLAGNNVYTFPFSQPTTENYGQIRGDHTFSVNDTMFARYTADDTQKQTTLNYPQFQDVLASRSQFSTLSESHVFSPALLNTARLSFSRFYTNITSPSLITGPGFSFVPGQVMGTVGIGGFTSLGPDATAPQRRMQNIFTGSDDLFYTRGRHSLKFGFLINRYQQYIQADPGLLGSATFTNLTTFLAATPSVYAALTPGSLLDRSFRYTTVGFYAQDDLRLRSNLTLNLGLRYEFWTVPVILHNQWSALRDIQHDATTTMGPPFKNSSLRNFSPRVGFAWDVRGDGKTAVRGGFSVLYDIGNIASFFIQNIPNDPPYSSGSTVTNPASFAIPLVFPPAAVGKALRPVDYLLKQPHMLQYNLTVEQQLPYQMVLTVAYAGSRGLNIYQNTEGNPTVPQVLADGRQFWIQNAPRTNPNWGTLDFYTAGASSRYDALQVGLKKRLGRGLEFQSSYTWATLMDHPQGQFNPETGGGGISKPEDATHLSLDWARAEFDVPQSWRFNATYQFQDSQWGGAAGKLLHGWRVSAIESLQSGYPLTPGLSANRSRSLTGGSPAGIDRPDLVVGRNNGNITSGTTAGCQGVAPGRQLGTPNLYFDPCAFTIPAAGFLGTAGRNILRGPGFANLDFSVAKDTALRFLGEGKRLEFRAEFFNILNHANFAMPSRIVYAAAQSVESPLANAGVITATLAPSRQIQLALKLLF